MTLKILGAATAALALAAPFASYAATPAAGAAARPAAAAAARPAAPAPAAAAPQNFPPPPGGAIGGVCIFSFDKAIGDSTVGAAYLARMQQLAAQVEAELTPERNAIQTDTTAFQGRQATLAADVRQQQGAVLNQRIQAYTEKVQLRNQEMDETKNRALQSIVVVVQPLLVSVYTQRGCSVVLDQGQMITANPSMDISPAVTAQLNTKQTTINFDRVHLDQAAGAARP